MFLVTLIVRITIIRVKIVRGTLRINIEVRTLTTVIIAEIICARLSVIILRNVSISLEYTLIISPWA